MAHSEEEIITTLRSRLVENLAKVEYDGPQQLIGGEIVTLLMDMLMGILDGCFNSMGNLNNARIKHVNFFQRSKLRRELIRDLYEGNRREYRVKDGEKVLAALVSTIEGSDDAEQDVLLNYVETEAREWTQTNYDWT